MAAPTTAALTAVWGSGANDVWILVVGGVVVHWNGTAWSTVPSGTTRSLWSIWGTAADDVWAAGDEGAVHWDGAAWSAVATGGWAFTGIRGTSAGDIWAVGLGGRIMHRGP